MSDWVQFGLAQAETRTYHALEPVFQITNAPGNLLFAISVIIIVSFVLWMYRRDSRDLQPGLATTLSGLRVSALLLIVVFLLNPERRTETQITKDSRLVILVDNSLSMGLQDAGSNADQRRSDQVRATLENNAVIRNLCRDHQTVVYKFGATTRPEIVANFNKIGSADSTIDTSRSNDLSNSNDSSVSVSWPWIVSAMVILTVSIFAAAGWWKNFGHEQRKTIGSWYLAAGVGCFTLAIGILGLSDVLHTNSSMLASFGLNPEEGSIIANPAKPVVDESNSEEQAEINWSLALEPSGTSTRLTEAIQYIVNREQGGSIAGIVVMTDGRNNSSLPMMRAVASASNAGIPIFPVGIGGTEQPVNVVVADVQIPPRAFPNDKFQIKGLVQGFGLEGKTIRIQLLSTDESGKQPETIEDEKTVRLQTDGKTSEVIFDTSRSQEGKRRYIVRAAKVDGDLVVRDNQRSGLIEILTKRTMVLMMAGGPTREFRFLRNQLYRDDDIELHVLLQSAKVGADQEADQLLEQFPNSQQDMFQYDCLIGFDPDWRALSENQSDLLERWVAEKAGGMIVVSGPVNTPEWTRRARGDQVIDNIRKLYPVSFYSQGTATLKLGRFGGVEAFPLSFTREGRASEFLWLADTATDSSTNWARFNGVYGYYAVNEAKSGADILARFADPQTEINGELPIYLASQFYGSGRVFFQASGEMWRVRKLNVDFFATYYLKLIRWVSQGRLLRDSNQGVLLADRNRIWMGGQVTIEAILKNAQDDPLLAQTVNASLRLPDGSNQDLELQSTKNAVRPGTFVGQFTASIEGDYRVALPIPDSVDAEVLTVDIQANIPDLEKQQSQRHDALLQELADKTGGEYYIGVQKFIEQECSAESGQRRIIPQDQKTYLPGNPDRTYTRKLMIWLLVLIVYCLSTEWILRRLHKLA